MSFSLLQGTGSHKDYFSSLLKAEFMLSLKAVLHNFIDVGPPAEKNDTNNFSKLLQQLLSAPNIKRSSLEHQKMAAKIIRQLNVAKN